MQHYDAPVNHTAARRIGIIKFAPSILCSNWWVRFFEDCFPFLSYSHTSSCFPASLPCMLWIYRYVEEGS